MQLDEGDNTKKNLLNKEQEHGHPPHKTQGNRVQPTKGKMTIPSGFRLVASPPFGPRSLHVEAFVLHAIKAGWVGSVGY